jgi:hypothetical protein
VRAFELLGLESHHGLDGKAFRRGLVSTSTTTVNNSKHFVHPMTRLKEALFCLGFE